MGGSFMEAASCPSPHRPVTNIGWPTSPTARPASLSQGQGMQCIFLVPTPVRAMHAPQPPMQMQEWQENHCSASPRCRTPVDQSTRLSAPLAPEWSNQQSDAMRKLLLNPASAQMPSAEEVLQQLQAVAPES